MIFCVWQDVVNQRHCRRCRRRHRSPHPSPGNHHHHHHNDDHHEILRFWIDKTLSLFQTAIGFSIPPEFLSSQWLNHWLLAEVGNSQWVSTFVKVRAENLRGLKEHGEKPSDGNRKMGRCGITMVNHWIGIAYFWTDPHVN